MTKPKALVIDFETTSTADLRKVGVYKYASDPTTSVLMVGAGFSDEQSVDILDFYAAPHKEIADWLAQGGRVVAHNAQFERVVWRAQLAQGRIDSAWAPSPYSRFDLVDTMIASAYFGGPMSLDLAGQAWPIKHQKNAAGHRIMLDFAAGRAAPGSHPEKFQQLADYCKDDVRAERDLYNLLPELPATIQREWLLDQFINEEGLPIDVDRVQQLHDLAAYAKPKLADRARDDYGVSLSSPTQLVDYFEQRGFEFGPLTKDKLDAYLELVLQTGDDDLAYLLELRRQYAKTSTAKLTRMLNCVEYMSYKGSRIRGAFQYYGAARTGRWAGRMVQPQNFPRPPKDFQVVDQVLDASSFCHNPPAILHDALEDILGINPLTAVSSALRSCIAAPPGYILVRVDFAQIEARVLAWLAGQQDVLDIFASGQDVYVHAASKIPGTDRMQPELARQLGKVATLGLGFGLGPDKFVELCAVQKPKIELDPDRAKEIVTAWRHANFHITTFWNSCATAFRHLTKSGPQFSVDLGKLRLSQRVVGGVRCIVVRLPSGRELFYHNPGARQGKWPNGSAKDELYHSGLDQYTNKWTTITTYGGKLAENFTQAVARDVMAEAMGRASSHALQLVGTVHDELIFLVKTTAQFHHGRLATIVSLIESQPTWAKGLPIKAEAAEGRRYGK